MTWILLCIAVVNEQATRDANRILVAQQAQAMAVSKQHREVECVQPVSHLTPEEEVLAARFRRPR
jgi:hypothetical protein